MPHSSGEIRSCARKCRSSISIPAFIAVSSTPSPIFFVQGSATCYTRPYSGHSGVGQARLSSGSGMDRNPQSKEARRSPSVAFCGIISPNYRRSALNVFTIVFEGRLPL